MMDSLEIIASCDLEFDLYGSETHLREVPIYVKSRIVTS